jgi:sulfite exporter TauE/SafE
LTSLTFMGGLLLGLASSLHCAGMCGGIGSSLTLTFAREGGTGARLKALGLAQLGKLASYATAGAILGAAGTALYGLFDREAAFALMQRFAALVLVWTALSLVGLLPAPSIMGRLFQPLRGWAWAHRRGGRTAATLAAGVLWGLLPCGMVYAALMYALLAGSALGGAVVMTGFALGVAPLLTASSLGVATIARLNRGPALRWVACLALIAFSVATVIWPMSTVGRICT